MTGAEAQCAAFEIRDTYRAYIRLPCAVLEDLVDSPAEAVQLLLVMPSKDPRRGSSVAR